MANLDIFDSLRKYGYAEGSYMSKCIDCDTIFIGDKRAFRCRACAMEKVTTETIKYGNVIE